MAQQANLYKLLGLSRTASADEIRAAYRKLARKHHPDVNPDNAAAVERFKDITAAHEVLSDPKRRALYDEFGHEGLRQGFDANAARAWGQRAAGPRGSGPEGAGGFEAFGDILGDLFGGGRAGGGMRMRGHDLSSRIEVDFVEAARGAEKVLRLPEPEPCPVCHNQPNKRMRCRACGGQGVHERMGEVTVRLPAGVQTGSRLRVANRGGFGSGGRGDLLLEVQVRPHRWFRREGRDLILRLPLSVAEAVAGVAVDVPTVAGQVTLRVPAGTQPGTRLRLRQKGIAFKEGAGDLFAEVQLLLPDRLDASHQAAAPVFAQGFSHPPREGLSF